MWLLLRWLLLLWLLGCLLSSPGLGISVIGSILITSKEVHDSLDAFEQLLDVGLGTITTIVSDMDLLLSGAGDDSTD